MQNANRDLQKYGRQMQKVGTNLTLGVTAPLIALGGVALNNYNVQAQALAQVEQGLITTGNAVGYTTDQLVKQAEALQNNSLFGDEKILKDATAQLLTFTNIAGEQFKRTTQAALDLSTRLDGDLKSSAIQLGKALNDPVANLSALSRSGIQFSTDQKATINSLVETNRLAEAQTIILDELEKQYGGSAKAAAEAGTGGLTQLKNILGDITEDFGKIINDGLKPLIAYVKDVALKFKDLSPETKKFIVILSGVAAAVGPLLALAGTILPAIGTGFALLTGPIGLIVAGLTAVGVIIYKNWAPIKAILVDIANYFVDLYNESTIFRVAVEGITTSFKNIYDTGAFVFGALGTIISAVANNIKEGFKPLGALIKAVLTGDIQQIPVILAAGFKNGLSNGKDLINDLGEEFTTLKTNIESNITQGIDNALSTKKYELLSGAVNTEALEKDIATAVNTGLNNGGNGGPFTPQTSKLEIDTQGLTGVGGVDFGGDLADTIVTDKLDENTLEFIDKLIQFKEDATEIMTATAVNFAAGFGDIIGGIAAGTNGLGDIAEFLLNTMGNLLQQLGTAAIAVSKTMIALKAAFVIPGASLAAGIGLVALGALLKGVAKNFAGNFTTGGIVGGNSFVGDKLFAGVNSGELILNTAQQNNLAAALSAGNNITLLPSLDFSGDRFRVMLTKVENKRGRNT